MFICTSLNDHCIALHYIFCISQYKLQGFNHITKHLNIILLRLLGDKSDVLY